MDEGVRIPMWLKPILLTVLVTHIVGFTVPFYIVDLRTSGTLIDNAGRAGIGIAIAMVVNATLIGVASKMGSQFVPRIRPLVAAATALIMAAALAAWATLSMQELGQSTATLPTALVGSLLVSGASAGMTFVAYRFPPQTTPTGDPHGLQH